MPYPLLLGKDNWIWFKSREYRALPSTREGRLLPELTLTHVYNVGAIFCKNDLNIVETDVKFHLVYQSDCAIDLCDVPHLVQVYLVRKTDTQALVGEYCLYMEPKSSVTENSIYCVHDSRQQL